MTGTREFTEISWTVFRFAFKCTYNRKKKTPADKFKTIAFTSRCGATVPSAVVLGGRESGWCFWRKEMQLRLTLRLFPGSHSAALLAELLASPIFIFLWCQLCFVCSFFFWLLLLFFFSPPQAGDKHYHPSCARCSRCNQMFTEGEEMYLQGKANPPVSSPRHKDTFLPRLHLFFMESVSPL